MDVDAAAGTATSVIAAGDSSVSGNHPIDRDPIGDLQAHGTTTRSALGRTTAGSPSAAPRIDGETRTSIRNSAGLERTTVAADAPVPRPGIRCLAATGAIAVSGGVTGRLAGITARTDVDATPIINEQVGGHNIDIVGHLTRRERSGQGDNTVRSNRYVSDRENGVPVRERER